MTIRRFVAHCELTKRGTTYDRVHPRNSKTTSGLSQSALTGLFKGAAQRVVARTYKLFRRHGTMTRRLFQHLSKLADRILQSPAIGGRILTSSIRLATRGRNSLPARALLTITKYSLAVVVQIHLGAGNKEDAIRAARIANLIFRQEVRARRGIAVLLYFETMFLCEWYDRIARDARTPEEIDSYFLNYVFGFAHLHLMHAKTSQYFLERAVLISGGGESIALRKLGCAFLIADDAEQAARNFQKSVEVDFQTVMAHQNYAARYDVEAYTPPQWELKNAGRLMIYDNLIQIGEEFYRQGQFERTIQFYQKAFEYQDIIHEQFPIPANLARKVSAACAIFDPNLPIRLLGYEWVTQIGHIGFLDHYMRVAQLDLIPKANYVLLAPRHKIANPAMLQYWNELICIIEDEQLISELFPYQRAVGDQFIAVRGPGNLAMPWSDFAARAQCEWAKQNREPLIRLNGQDRDYGQNLLMRAGLRPPDWYVGLHVREGGFHGDGPGTIAAHRSARVDDYFEAIDEITARGGWVIRLGDRSMTPLPRMARVIDYAHSAMKSPRMDVFLFATSRFVIGTTSGPTNAIQSFGTPMLVTNAISNDSQPWTANTKFILKRVYDRRHKRYLSLNEIYRQPLRSYLINNEILRRHGYEVQSNTRDEIRRAVQDMLDVGSDPRSGGPDTSPLMRDYRAAIVDKPYIFGAARPALPFLSNIRST